MKIADYLREIEYATTTIMNTIWAERKRMQQLEAELKSLERIVTHSYQQAQSWQDSEDLHWEDGKFTTKTEECFKLLTADVCPKFADFEKQNHGFHLISHLGWSDFEKFKSDLLSLE